MRGAAPLLALFIVGCGAAQTPSPGVTASEEVEDAGALQVLAIPRPTAGRVWLSLWIDAGTRDGAPGAAALAAAALSTDTVHARALPDGIELQQTCSVDGLAGCLDTLATAVSRRDIPESARERLREARRRALPDLARRADGLAVSALLGRDVDPLLGAEASAADAASFLEEHAGAGRLLLIAVGEVERGTLVSAARDAFDGVPPAGAPRSERAPFETDARVEVDAEAHAAVAVTQPSVARALGLARRLLGRHRAVAADVFVVRGAGIVVLRGAEPEVLVQAAQVALAESPTEGTAPLPDSPLALARQQGARWVSRGDIDGAAPALGVGAVIAGGRGDDLGAEDPDHAMRQAAVGRLRSALRPPALRIQPSDNGGPATIAGAQVWMRTLAGAPDAAVVLRFEGGASEEAASAHGFTWMLASLAQSGCSRVARDELGSSPEQLGVDVRAFVEPDAWGLALSGPRDRYRELIYLAVRCAEVPHRGRLEAARAEGVADAERHALAAAGAHLLAPHCPGRVRPEGSADGINAIHRASLERWRRRVATRTRLRAAFVGDAPLDAVAARFGQLLGRLPEGSPLEPLAWPRSEETLATLHRAEGIGVLVAWETRADGDGAALAAGVFAQAVGESLRREPGLRVEAVEAGASAGHAWATVQLAASEVALTALPQHLERALADLPWDDRVDAQNRRATEAEAASGASARGLAARIVARGQTQGESEAEPAVARALAASVPRYVIAREQVGHR